VVRQLVQSGAASQARGKLTGVIPLRRHSVEPVIQNVTTGKASAEDSPDVDCSSEGTCGIMIEDFTVKVPDGKSEVLCANTPSDVGVTCTAGASG
jgi:hypothetical protein